VDEGEKSDDEVERSDARYLLLVSKKVRMMVRVVVPGLTHGEARLQHGRAELCGTAGGGDSFRVCHPNPRITLGRKRL
jgi:hypothetical protein